MLDDAVGTQDALTQLVAAIRVVAREVPGAHEIMTAARGIAHDYSGPGKAKIAWDDEAARGALVDALVIDALLLLGLLPERELGEKAANAVGLLALVAGQDVEPGGDSDGRDGRWRMARRAAPDRAVSIVDPTPGTSIRAALAIRMATRSTWLLNPRPGCSTMSP